jgi:DNA mismatch repair protein MutL
MATRIRILPEQLTNKIAAGEVVERPASVVKELVENALDAGSSDICVEIEGGGKKLIKVTDNGSGMTREDALLALERHATSKIASDADLFSLTTLGFRGEAVPSIASVSRLTLATKEQGALEGAEIYLEGGRVREVKSCGMADGTVFAVRNLFFNTPARLKFMKSTETETGHIGETLTRLALSRPEVRFTYLSEGKPVFRVLTGDLRSRVASLLGTKVAADLHDLDFGDGDLSLQGLLGGPASCRSSASNLYTFINGRFVRDRVVQHAILQGYRQVLERGRYPVVVLFIELPPGEVDVNVHPTKHEVRFREQGRIHDLIQGAIEQVLRTSPWLTAGRGGQRELPSASSQSRVQEVREALLRYAAKPAQPNLFRGGATGQQPTGGGWQQTAPQADAVPHEQTLADAPTDSGAVAAAGYYSSLGIIGQFRAAYLLCQDDEDNLVLIDQHAAHERVAFERLRRQFSAGEIESQGLLFPEPQELSHLEAAVVRQNVGHLQQLGFDLEHFGGLTWLIKAAPRMLANLTPVQLLRDLLEEFRDIGKGRSFEDALDAILATIACHSVVRGTHPLREPEIRELLRLMDLTDFAAQCPHGRPVSRAISLAEIEKMFRRG